MTKQKYLLILFLSLALVGLISIVAGTTFAFFSADIKGETVNEVSTSEMKVVYTESSNPVSLGVLTDETAINSTDYFDFSLLAQTDKNSSFEYYVYLSEEPQNTIDKDNIKVYLTDDTNTPINDNYTTQKTKNGIYCYDYTSNKIYTSEDKEYNKCHNIDITDNFYLMDKTYYNKVKNKDSLICRKYTKTENSIINEVVETTKCRYGDVYKAKPIKYTDLETNEELNLKNIIYKGIYKNIDGTSYYNDEKSNSKKSFRLKLWTNNLQNEEVEVTKSKEGKEINQNKETFKYKVNVYAKQVELSK